jgi:hypothetical protein
LSRQISTKSGIRLLFPFLPAVKLRDERIFLFMTAETKKQSNRSIQREQATYKKKSEISEALNLIRPFINVSTFKFLSHFLHTNGTGATQAKIKTICEKAEISTGIYSKIVKPEIEGVFSQPLVIKSAGEKKDKLGRKNKGSEYKSLMPLSVIKHLVRQKQAEINEKETAIFWNQITIENDDIFDESDTTGDTTGDITGDITSNEKIPCESKGEDGFSHQQNSSLEKTFRKDLKIINNNQLIKETNSAIKSPVKKFGIKKEIQALLKNNDLAEMTEEQKYQCGNRIQIFLSKYSLDLANEEDLLDIVTDVCRDCMNYYETGEYGAFYVSLENRFFDYLLELKGVDVQNLAENREYEQLTELREQVKYAYLQGALAIEELAVTAEIKPKTQPKRWNQGKKPIRTEMVPSDWKPADVYYKQFEQPKATIPLENNIMAKINAFRASETHV